jgi:hypothetical protein
MVASVVARVDLHQLHEHTALTRPHVEDRVGAACVMLSKFHESPLVVGIDWEEVDQENLELAWTAPDVRTQMTHANELDATEDGAYAVSFAVATHAGYTVGRRAHHGSGSDYLLTRQGEPENDFVRLEVRGIARIKLADRRLLDRALEAKVDQLGQGDLDRPGIAMVVGFEYARVIARTVAR